MIGYVQSVEQVRTSLKRWNNHEKRRKDKPGRVKWTASDLTVELM